MQAAFIEKIYAGWLAKIIGIRLGAPIEGWTYKKIQNIYGKLNHYPVDYRDFAADDDSNGPLFFLKALEDGRHGFDLQAQDVAEALLNYAPFEHGFFWWGGYGISTEHTAYLNLRNGIPAPKSGSIEQNGYATAEQIGGQIFIDTWGLVTPGNPDLAAVYAEKAASVTHGGNGIYGGIFVATCISQAFVEQDIHKIIRKGLSYIPVDCEYARVVKAVMNFHAVHPKHWRDCFQFIFDHFGYDKYPGNCHIIPNIAVMILALLYGQGDFSDTINICNMCGWDTDCNVGNVATIMGVRNGLEGINAEKWRKPINDFLACSSVIGSLNIMDIPFGASYIVKMAYALSNQSMPEPWQTITSKHIDSCHFEYPGSTHAIRVRTELNDARSNQKLEVELINSDETAYSGQRSLKVLAMPVYPAERVYVYKKTYYRPEDFHDSRYDPSFSPLLYPGQTVHGSACIPEYAPDALVCLYVRDSRTGQIITSEKTELKKGQWQQLSLDIPPMDGALLDEMGFQFNLIGLQHVRQDFVGFVDDLFADGQPHYSIDFSKEQEEVWTGLHREVSQMTKLKGLMYLTDDSLHLSCSDFAEAYTGHHNWDDYTATFELTPQTGFHHLVNVRVQGAIRSYAAGLLPDGQFGILKNDNGYSVLAQTNFDWVCGKVYTICVKITGNRISAVINDTTTLTYTDQDRPWTTGSIGVAVRQGSHCSYQRIRVE